METKEPLPGERRGHFDAELADTDALPVVSRRWAVTGNDGFLDLLLSAPFEELEFGERAYDDAASGQ